ESLAPRSLRVACCAGTQEQLVQAGGRSDEQPREPPAEAVAQNRELRERLHKQAAKKAAHSSCNDCGRATLEEQFRWPGGGGVEGIDQAQSQGGRDPQEQALERSCQKGRTSIGQPPEEPAGQGTPGPADGTFPDEEANGHCRISRTHFPFILEGARATGKL